MDLGEDNGIIDIIDVSSPSSSDDIIEEDQQNLIAIIPEEINMGSALIAQISSRGNVSRELALDDGLAASHSYLGGDLEEIGGRLIFTELTTVVIPLLPGVYGTLLPGQTFPLTVHDHGRITLLRKCVEGDHTFGCISARYHYSAAVNSIIYGTTVEIYEFSDNMGIVRIKARGRQRFRLLSSKPSSSGYGIGEVLILPEIRLPHPFTALHLSSLNSLRVADKERCRRIESNFLAWPKWLYDMYDPEKLVKRCDASLEFLKQGLRKDKVENVMPKDPTELSFWIASQLDSEKRLLMLALNSPIPRLRWLLHFLSKRQTFYCENCEAVIGKYSDCFAMSVEGAQGTYVNPDGYHHDTITLLKVENVVPISSPSTHFSWFPGYAWSISVCKNCQKHMGWQFISSNPNRHPSKFWGLTRQSLKTMCSSKDNAQRLEDLPVM